MIESAELTSEEKKYKNRPSLSPEEKALVSEKLGSISPYKEEKRVWQAEIDSFGTVLLKDIRFSDVNCEAAAYIISDILGFNIVAPTVVREINGRPFSVQMFLVGARELPDSNEYDDQLFLIWLFDHIIRSNDREIFNLLLVNGKVKSIDHEAAFYSLDDETHYDTFRSFYGEECPKTVVPIFQKLIDKQDLIEFQLKRDLSGLLEKNDIEETIRRIFYIARLIVEFGKIDSLKILTEVPK